MGDQLILQMGDAHVKIASSVEIPGTVGLVLAIQNLEFRSGLFDRDARPEPSEKIEIGPAQRDARRRHRVQLEDARSPDVPLAPEKSENKTRRQNADNGEIPSIESQVLTERIGGGSEKAGRKFVAQQHDGFSARLVFFFGKCTT